MAENPSPGDDPHRAPPDRPESIIGLISETLGEDNRTKNLILLVIASGMTIAVVVDVLVLLAKGMHGLANPAAWLPGGAVGGPCLVWIVVWIRRARRGGAISGDRADGKHPASRAVEQSRSQVPQERIPRQARRTRPQGTPSRKRRSLRQSPQRPPAHRTRGSRQPGKAGAAADRVCGSRPCARGCPLPAEIRPPCCHLLAPGTSGHPGVGCATAHPT